MVVRLSPHCVPPFREGRGTIVLKWCVIMHQCKGPRQHGPILVYIQWKHGGGGEAVALPVPTSLGRRAIPHRSCLRNKMGFERKKRTTRQRFLLKLDTWQKERGNKCGKVGDYKCKRSVWWGNHAGGGMYEALMAWLIRKWDKFDQRETKIRYSLKVLHGTW